MLVALHIVMLIIVAERFRIGLQDLTGLIDNSKKGNKYDEEVSWDESPILGNSVPL